MKFLLLAVFGQSLATWVARDSSMAARGPQGASDSDTTHTYSDGGYRWPWLSMSYMGSDPSSYKIYKYYTEGLDGLTGKLLN